MAYSPVPQQAASAVPLSLAGGRSALEKPLPVLSKRITFASRLSLACKRLMQYWWAWELLAATLSITAAVALVIVLIEYDERPQQDIAMGTLNFSLNALVAALSTVLRSSLMVAVTGPLNQSAWNRFAARHASQRQVSRELKDLDSFGGAATDAWSSLKVLWRTKGWNIAALGALIALLSLAFGAFTQQVLSTEIRNVTSSGRAEDLSPQAFMPRLTAHIGDQEDDAEIYSPLNLQAAFMSSLFNTNATPPMGVCPTGNCAWPTTPTLAVCGACSDVKDRALLIVGNSSLSYTLSWPGLPQDWTTNTTFTLLWSDFQDIARQDMSDYNRGGLPELLIEGRVTLANFNFIGIPPLYADLIDRLQPFNATHINNLVVAHHCSLFFCIQAYSSNATDGRTTQRLEATWDQWQLKDENDTILRYEIVQDGAPKKLNVTNSAEFQISYNSVYGVYENLLPLLNGSVPFVESPISHINLMQWFWNASNSTTTMDTFIQQISDNMSSFFRTFRSSKMGFDTRFAPNVFVETTFVVVRWQWLAFPLGLLITGHIFLAATIWHTRRLRVRPWKGHRIPFLLADVDDIVKQLAMGGMSSRTGLEERIGRLKVHLEYDGKDGVAFRREQ
ncbi:hypothetical protein GGR51DRAFT_566012 [Nemania sp. FL0031]|nr:hypothetical protein GGR51DRAFT_566012 [Nemania sp. FL0031]